MTLRVQVEGGGPILGIVSHDRWVIEGAFVSVIGGRIRAGENGTVEPVISVDNFARLNPKPTPSYEGRLIVSHLGPWYRSWSKLESTSELRPVAVDRTADGTELWETNYGTLILVGETVF